MSAHHGPPCGHTMLGTCPVCGGHPIEVRISAAEQTFAMTNATRTYAPVTVTAEAMAEARRKFEELGRLREENEAAIRRLHMKLAAYAPFRPDGLGVRSLSGSAIAPDGSDEARIRYMVIGPTIQGTFYIPPTPVDPLDVEHDGVRLRDLLDIDARRRDERNPFRTLTPAQRAAVSAHWSAQLRAKVAASAAVDKARETSVVVDMEDW